MNYVTSKWERDKGVIVNVIRSFGPVSRVEIHRLTQIRLSTISQVTKELLADEIVLDDGLWDNPTGRKQILLRINPAAGFILAIEFDAEEVTTAVLDLAPEIRALSKVKTIRERGVEGVVGQLIASARQAMKTAGVNAGQLRGIGIADVGPVNRKLGVSMMSSQMEFWREVPLRRIFEEEFGVPVYLDNATRCRGNAERLIGAGERCDDMVYVEYGAGIGSAIISGGRSIEGSHTSAGEFGHTRVVDEGLPCKCGSFGCLEAMAGAAALANRFREIAIEGVSSLALTLAGGERQAVSGWHVIEAAREGDKLSSVVVGEMLRYLALALGNVVNLLDPSRIVLDRRLQVAGEDFPEQLARAIRMQALSHITGDLVVCYGKLREEAGVMGAALMVLEEIFAIPELKPPRFLMEAEGVEAGAR